MCDCLFELIVLFGSVFKEEIWKSESYASFCFVYQIMDCWMEMLNSNSYFIFPFFILFQKSVICFLKFEFSPESNNLEDP